MKRILLSLAMMSGVANGMLANAGHVMFNNNVGTAFMRNIGRSSFLENVTTINPHESNSRRNPLELKGLLGDISHNALVRKQVENRIDNATIKNLVLDFNNVKGNLCVLPDEIGKRYFSKQNSHDSGEAHVKARPSLFKFMDYSISVRMFLGALAFLFVCNVIKTNEEKCKNLYFDDALLFAFGAAEAFDLLVVFIYVFSFLYSDDPIDKILPKGFFKEFLSRRKSILGKIFDYGIDCVHLFFDPADPLVWLFAIPGFIGKYTANDVKTIASMLAGFLICPLFN